MKRAENEMPVHLQEVEAAVIGACLTDSGARSVALGMLKREMFYDRDKRVIFEAMARMEEEGKAVDVVTVVDELRRAGTLGDAGGPYGVAKLVQETVTTANIEYHCMVLTDYAARRELFRLLSEKTVAAGDMTVDYMDTVAELQAGIEGIVNTGAAEQHSFTAYGMMEKVSDMINERMGSTRGGLTGISTGIDGLDRLTCGWQRGSLIYTAGRPGDGKTNLDLLFARTAAKEGLNVMFNSLEMKAVEIGERILAAESGVNPANIKRGMLSPEELKEVDRAMGRIMKWNLTVNDTPYSNIDQLCMKVRSLNTRKRLDLVIVDYLQLLSASGTRRQNREQEVAECSRKLKWLARSVDCPVIVSSQLNRAVEDTPTRIPELHNLRESGAIEQDADIVILLHRPSRYGMRIDPLTGKAPKGKCNLIVAKNRNGETGEVGKN